MKKVLKICYIGFLVFIILIFLDIVLGNVLENSYKEIVYIIIVSLVFLYQVINMIIRKINEIIGTCILLVTLVAMIVLYYYQDCYNHMLIKFSFIGVLGIKITMKIMKLLKKQ